MPPRSSCSPRFVLAALAYTGVALGPSGCVRWGEDNDDSEMVFVETYGPQQTGDPTNPTDPTNATTPSPTGDSGPDDTGDTSDTSDTSDTEDPPTGFDWPEAWPLDPDARIVAFGKTGIPTRNLELIRNIYLELGTSASSEATSTGSGSTGGATETGGTTGTGGATETGGDSGEPAFLRILWIDDCDPRTDSVGCLAGNVRPFFTMVEELGTIDFRPLSEVDPLGYDVVIADFCGPVTPPQVGDMLGAGARVLVLGDSWCSSPLGLSSELANGLLEHFGTRFNTRELYNHEFLVPDARQVGMLEDSAVLDLWGVSLQELAPEFTSLLATGSGTVLSSREG